MKNIWIITEERPKSNVIKGILEKIASDFKFKITFTKVKVMPIIEKGKFYFSYKVEGVRSKSFGNVFIKIASGYSSFVDFLIFIQEKEPDQNSMPLYAIEETKTDDSESRNTGIYQRCSKFVYINLFYPKIKKIMLYNLQIAQKKVPTATNIFGTKLLLTMRVEVLGKKIDSKIMRPFKSAQEIIEEKHSMALPRGRNIPIRIIEHANKITISGRLYKSEGLSHDPNIGALSIISACLRKWEKKKEIVITKHGLSQKHVGKTNKFIQIANKLNIKLDKLIIPKTTFPRDYWHYDISQEKVASIFAHLVIENCTKARSIYENHGGSERGYFFDPQGKPIAIKKYQEGKRTKYKRGDKTAIVYIPDLIIFDPERKEITNIEGKKYSTRKAGIKELKNYKYIENKIIKPLYHPKKISRTVVVFGSKLNKIKEKQVGLMLNESGLVIVNKSAPVIIKEAINKLFST